MFALQAEPASASAIDVQSAASSYVQVRDMVPAGTKTPQCCAGAWYPWGWWATLEECEAQGDHLVDTIPTVLTYKCPYSDTDGPVGLNYHLYVFEAG